VAGARRRRRRATDEERKAAAAAIASGLWSMGRSALGGETESRPFGNFRRVVGDHGACLLMSPIRARAV
jgi:hypothetical protein